MNSSEKAKNSDREGRKIHFFSYHGRSYQHRFLNFKVIDAQQQTILLRISIEIEIVS